MILVARQADGGGNQRRDIRAQRESGEGWLPRKQIAGAPNVMLLPVHETWQGEQISVVSNVVCECSDLVFVDFIQQRADSSQHFQDVRIVGIEIAFFQFDMPFVHGDGEIREGVVEVAQQIENMFGCG